MKKKINERAGSKKQKSKKQLKKKTPQQIILIEKSNNGKEDIALTNWSTFLSENQGLL